MQDTVSLIVVALAAAYVGRNFLRTVTGKSCGCGKSSCPAGNVEPGEPRNHPHSLLRLPILPE